MRQMQLQNYNMRPVWDALLEVYAPISAILSRNGISYWVACGTTLGAARHKGFIPWDDDFDICVPNHLMDKVKEVLERELPPYLKVVSFENTPEFEEIYLKVQDSRVDIVQNVERESGTSRPHGIYVDIFPLDGMPDSRIVRLWLKIKSISLFCIWNTRFNRFTHKTWRYYFCALLSYGASLFLPKILSNIDVQKLRKTWALQYRFGQTLMFGRYTGNYKHCYSYASRTAYFAETIQLDFEDIEVPVPKSYDGYLTSIYGDWRALPPVEMRTMPSHEELPVAPWKFGPTTPKEIK
jgi:lipopolysaccharide cholinephosphotransferase